MAAASDSEREGGERERERPREGAGSPSGMPGALEDQPLGVERAEPEVDRDDEDERERGPGAMPGIPTEGEPPSAG